MLSGTCCHVHHLGLVEYTEALHIQKELATKRSRNEIPNTLLLLEHPPTYTLGPKSDDQHFFVPADWIENKQVAVHRVDRGGGITFHGPGQLVGYPVLKLGKGNREIVRYIRNLEDMLIMALRSFGIQGDKRQDRLTERPVTGVWIENEKIGAIGIKVDVNMVTHHGFALNVNIDLRYFEKIIPCGIRDHSVTSMSRLLGHVVPMEQARHHVMKAFGAVFNFELIHRYAKRQTFQTGMDTRPPAPG